MELIERIRQNVPQILRDLPAWLLHDAHKTPIYADGSNRRGNLDSTEDRGRLVTFEQAANALARVTRAIGLGIALGDVPGEEIRLCGVDLDKCYHGGELEERAMQILGAADSYAERSPSGNGLHILGTGNVGTLKVAGAEIYSGGRYFTVTGHRLNGAHLADITEAAALTRNLFSAGEVCHTPRGDDVQTVRKLEDGTSAGHDEMVSALMASGLYLRDAGNGKHLIRCPWEARHTPDEGGSRQTSSSEAAYFGAGAEVRGETLENGMFRCQHAHCADRKLRHLREYLGLHKADEPAKAVPKRSPIAWASLQGQEPPAREWIIPHWIPARHTTLLAGRGGIGKTLVAQHIASALALGHEYLEPIEPRRVLMWAGEDDQDELWRRQRQVSSWMMQPLSALSERFYLHSYDGVDITLMAPVFGALATTPMLTELREQVGDYRAEVVILDNIARLFGGNENDRHAVTTFCAMVQGACAPAAVILLGHPAKAAGSEFSGSTAWEGAVRARLYLSDRPPDQDEDDDAPIDDRVRYLSRRKANYSALDIRRMTMADGVLIPDAVEPARRTQQPSGEFLKDIVRRAVRKLAEKDLFGSESDRAGNYLPRLARKYKLLETANEKAFGGAMRELIMAGELKTRDVGQDRARRPRTGLVLVVTP